jgi:cyclic pyranopterin phosphate synthase
MTFLPRQQVLGFEEIVRIARLFVGQGVKKIRLTGGEPLVRRGIVDLCRQISALPGLLELVMTSNGSQLGKLAVPLVEAGVKRLNISLDSLHPETFAGITRGGDLGRVLAGIAAAEALGFPIKINMVVMRGINDAEVADFAALTVARPITVRFIEYMPAARVEDYRSLLVPGDEVLAAIARRFPLETAGRGELCGPARNFRIAGAAGSLGVITPLSGHFCGDCNRIRVTSTGFARSCLFGDGAVGLKPFLAAGGDTLDGVLRRLVEEKPAGHRLDDPALAPAAFTMAAIGG